MGSKKVIRRLRVKGTLFILTALLLILTGGFLLSIHPEEDQMIAFVLAIAMLVGGAVLLFFGIDNWKGKNSRYVKKNPGMLEMADDLLETTVYQDKFVIISKKAIAAKKDLATVAALDDVLAVYEYVHRTNGMADNRAIKLELINGRTVSIGIYGRKKATKDNLMLTISHYCPNAALGYSGEIMDYVRTKRKEYRTANSQ